MLEASHIQAMHENYPVVTHLSRHLQDALSRQGQAVSAADGTSLFAPGDVCNSFVMVTSGAIRVAVGSGSGREIELYRVQPGDSCILTVSCLLGNALYPASGSAVGELERRRHLQSAVRPDGC